MIKPQLTLRKKENWKELTRFLIFDPSGYNDRYFQLCYQVFCFNYKELRCRTGTRRKGRKLVKVCQKSPIDTQSVTNISSLSGEGQRVRGRKLASRAQDKSGVNNHGCREKVITNLNYQVENLNSTAQQQYTEESSPCYI